MPISHRNRPQFLQAWKMYDLLPMVAISRLPDEGFDTRPLVISNQGHRFPVYCLPKSASQGRRKHRVIVICTCGQHVPFGRMGQHYNVLSCPTNPQI